MNGDNGGIGGADRHRRGMDPLGHGSKGISVDDFDLHGGPKAEIQLAISHGNRYHKGKIYLQNSRKG
ncbi:MAG: hypothetical protein OHK0012_04430 [Synechococcales cyanobacterium]